MDFYLLICTFVPMKLSIIIPVYRVEDTLNRCVESVLNQNLDDFEVILVDDGSPDKCPQMCDDWAEKNANIRVVHKPNGGLSDARNAGVEKAQGDYITFVDSDDYIATDTYQPLLATLARKTDVDIIEQFSTINLIAGIGVLICLSAIPIVVHIGVLFLDSELQQVLFLAAEMLVNRKFDDV